VSYTSEELVRQHLTDAVPRLERMTDQPLVLGTDQYAAFFSGPVEEDTVRVKSLRGGDPVRLTITLTDGATIIAAAPLAAGSVVVAGDSSLGTVYQENLDYVIDYPGASLYIKEGGSLTVGDSVVVWCHPFVLYAAGSDYQLRAVSGELRRLPSGTISANETVYLDYTPLSGTHDESLVRAAVLEANGLVAAEVDPDGSFGADPVLQAAATYVALAVICRSSAAGALSTIGADRSAAAWMNLAEQYGREAEKRLRSFRPPVTGPAAPRRS